MNNFYHFNQFEEFTGKNDINRNDVMKIKTKIGDVYMTSEPGQGSEDYCLCTFNTALFLYNWRRLANKDVLAYTKHDIDNNVGDWFEKSTEKYPVTGFPHLGDLGLTSDATGGFINNMSRLKWLILNDAEFVPLLIPRSKVSEYRAAFEAFPER